jgi:translation initiation factor IF-3
LVELWRGGSKISNKIKLNASIRAPKVRLIDQDGEQLGVVSLREALLKAEEAGMDLLQVSPDSEEPVCKIIDYGKFKYDQDKKLQKSKQQQKAQELKSVRLSVKIGRHDFETKLAAAQKFIEKGHKVSLQLRFKGREMAHMELGEKVLRNFAAEIPNTIIEQEPKMLGRGMSMTIASERKNN